MDFERDVIFRVGPPSLYRTCKNPARHSSPQKNHAIMRKFRGWSALSFEKHKDQGGATSGGRRWRRAVSSAYIHQHHPNARPIASHVHRSTRTIRPCNTYFCSRSFPPLPRDLPPATHSPIPASLRSAALPITHSQLISAPGRLERALRVPEPWR